MSATVQSEPKFHQARCERCGWHTWPVDQRQWAERMATQHDAVCPNPEPPRSGGLMSCGCWCYISPGAAVGDSEQCPRHGVVTIERANADEPDGEKLTGHWTATR